MSAAACARTRVLLLAVFVLAALLAVAVGLRPAGSAGGEPGAAAAPGQQETAAAGDTATAVAAAGSVPAEPGPGQAAKDPGATGHRHGTDGPVGPGDPAGSDDPARHDEVAGHGGAPGGEGPAGAEPPDWELAATASRPGRPATPPELSGNELARAAAEDPGEQVPGQARRGPAPDRMSGLPVRAAISPEQVHGEHGQAPGGCLPVYGGDGQCLPAVPPSMAGHVADMERAGLDPTSMDHHWSCRELRTFFPDGIAVRVEGVDPQELDRDGDGLACGPGD